MTHNSKTYTLLMISMLAFSCTDLNVENLNEPDASDALQSSGDLESLISGSYYTFFFKTEYFWPASVLSGLADEVESNQSWAYPLHLLSEPRIAITNDASSDDYIHLEKPWGVYSAISSVNDGLFALLRETDPIVIGTNGKDTQRAIAFARFIQGISYCYLGSLFDRAYIFDETTDLGTIGLSPHEEVTAAGIGYLEKCISICEANNFTIPSSGWVNGLEISSEYLGRVCHSYIARYLSCSTRTPEGRRAVSSEEVISHINDGINEGEGFGAYNDGYVNWYSDFRYITALGFAARADYKTIGLTDTSENYLNWLADPVADRTGFEIHTADRRITGATGPQSAGLYYQYEAPGSLPLYSFTNYDKESGTAQFLTLSYREMKLLKAEYLFYSDNKSEAAIIVNESRFEIGELPELTGDENDFFKWLKYEKKIECFMIPGLAFFDRRGWTGDSETGQETDLVSGTPIHFPFPVMDLIFEGIDNYSFGGEGVGSAPKVIE